MFSSYKETIEKKFHPAGTDYNAIVAHELGHAIDHYLSEKKGHAVSSDLLKTVSMQYQRAGKRLDGETMTNELSGYATSNAREFFAEAMAEYKKVLRQSDIEIGTDDAVTEITVKNVEIVMVSGVATVYIKSEDGAVYKGYLETDEALILIEAGDKLKISYSESGIDKIYIISSWEFAM